MSDNNKSNRTDTVCSISGRLYYYDACGDEQNQIKAECSCFVYMGSGTIHSVNGAPYNSDRTFHFWRYNDRTLIEAR